MKTPEIPSPVPNPEALAQLDELAQAITLAEAARAELKSAIEAKDEVKQAAAMAKLRPALAQGRGLRRKLEGESPMSISVETITLDLDQKLEESLNFYQTHGIDLPPDFEAKATAIWADHYEAIKEAMETGGFDDLLIVPPDLSLPELHQKLTAGYQSTYGGSNFQNGGSFAGVIEANTATRLVLVHRTQNLADRPELKSTLGQTAEVLIKQGEALTLTDYLLYQRKYFEATGKHLDEKGWTWLPGSQLGDGRVVRADWSPGSGQLHVDADSAVRSGADRGCRLSRQFS